MSSEGAAPLPIGGDFSLSQLVPVKRELVWVPLTWGKWRRGAALQEVRGHQAKGNWWGGVLTVQPNPLDGRLVVDQALWYLTYRRAIGTPQLQDLINVNVADEIGWDHLAEQTVELIHNLENLTHGRVLVYASEYAAEFLPGWPWGRQPWPPEVIPHG